MRISTTQLFTQGIASMLDNQSRIARSQQQISSGLRILSPADDPVGSVQIAELSRAVEKTEQFIRNGQMAENRLRLEESAIGSATDLLQRIHELAIQANNASQTNQTRGIIAKEVREHLQSLLQYANTRDSNGRYLFGGFQEEVQPFAQSGAGFVYNGDEGQRQLQIGPSRRVADSDPGSRVFGSIREGNGTFATSANAANTGTGVIDGGAVVNAALYDGDTYTIRFTAADSYEVVDSAAAVVATGSFESGDEISFQGISVTVTGEPAAGDEFTAAPSAQRDILSMVSDLLVALETPRGNGAERALQTNEINAALANITQGLDHLVEVRTDVGARLHTIELQTDINEGSGLQFQERLSSIRDADLASVISQFNQQLLGLQAAQQAFAKVQGLSLFNFL